MRKCPEIARGHFRVWLLWLVGKSLVFCSFKGKLSCGLLTGLEIHQLLPPFSWPCLSVLMHFCDGCGTTAMTLQRQDAAGWSSLHITWLPWTCELTRTLTLCISSSNTAMSFSFSSHRDELGYEPYSLMQRSKCPNLPRENGAIPTCIQIPALPLLSHQMTETTQMRCTTAASVYSYIGPQPVLTTYSRGELESADSSSTCKAGSKDHIHFKLNNTAAHSCCFGRVP